MKAASSVNKQSTALGVTVRKVIVEQVVPERNVAIVRDAMGYLTEIPYKVQQGRARMPRVGDMWYVDRSMGPWVFSAYIAKDDTDMATFTEYQNFSSGLYSGGTISLPDSQRVKVGSTNSDARFAMSAANAGAALISGRVNGDTSSRTYLDNNGYLWFGSGSGGIDTNLYRLSAGVLKTDGSINVTGTVTAGSIKAPAQSVLTLGSVSNSTAETVIGTFSGAVPANVLDNTAWRFYVHGSTNGTTSTPTITLRVRLDSASGTSLASFVVMTYLASGGIRRWSIAGDLMVTAAGASGAISGTYRRDEHIQATGPAGAQTLVTGATGLDLTVAHTIVITAQWGTASATNEAETLGGYLARTHAP